MARRGRGGALALGAGIGACLIAAVSALGVGGLRDVGCIQDRDTLLSACARSAEGLEGAHSVRVSPDGESVYVASVHDDAVVTFDRDPLSGRLRRAGCIGDDDAAHAGCPVATPGLGFAHWLALSPDGESVYVASQEDDALVHLRRDPATGALAPTGCIDDDDPPAGPDECAESSDGLDGSHWVAVSSDGESVYAAGRYDDAVAVFTRDIETGDLTPAGCVEDVGGPDDCNTVAEGLDDVLALEPSPDGSSLYAVSKGDSAVVRFDRDAGTGALTPRGCIEDSDSPAGVDCARATEGLSTGDGVTVSPDGASVYVGGKDDDAIAIFARDTETGRLQPLGCVSDDDTGAPACERHADGLDGIEPVVISPDGGWVYAAGSFDDAVVALRRDPVTGALRPRGCIDDADAPDGPDECAQSTIGLDGAHSLALDPAGASLYVAGDHDDSVVRFRRDAAP